MPTPPEYPHRLRQWGADVVCATGPHPTWTAGITACGVLPVTPDEQRLDTEPVTCLRCIKELTR